MMKFSVLLPTRNRLDLLKYAVESIRRQDYPDWEIIVSDNYSDEDVRGYVQSLKDKRIKYYRTKEFIPVTDNWNNAMDQSTGDYVVMLGDDDCLMSGYFSSLRNEIEHHNHPDLIYTGAYLFSYPGVKPGFPNGFLRSYCKGKIYRNKTESFWMHEPEARRWVDRAFNFKAGITFNSQIYLISRHLIEKMKPHGSFYQSPYPDVYSSCMLMLKAKNILVVPHPLVTIGISPKSFGFYYFNELDEEGNKFLKNETDNYASWLQSMELVARNIDDVRSHVNYRRYDYCRRCVAYARRVSGSRLIPRRYRILVSGMLSIVPDPRVTGRLFRDAMGRMTPRVKGDFRTIQDVYMKVHP